MNITLNQTLGKTVIVKVYAVNDAGLSKPTNLTLTYAYKPDPVVELNLTDIGNAVLVSFKDGNDNGAPITNY